MAPKTFFTLALTLPVVTLIVARVTDPLGALTSLLMIAAPAYIVCAIILSVWFALTRTHRQLVVATLIAPAVMAVALVAEFIVYDPKGIPLTVHRILQLAEVAPYGLLFGSIYVGVAWGLYALGTRVGVIKDVAAV